MEQKPLQKKWIVESLDGNVYERNTLKECLEFTDARNLLRCGKHYRTKEGAEIYKMMVET